MTKTRNPGPWAYRSASDAIRAARKMIKAGLYDIHALRHSVAMGLLKAGYSDALTASLTGQSMWMVEHYTRHGRQYVRAQEVQERRK